MANSKLLKEAIADAKAVKETALANAKLALEEAFTPRLQSILSKKMKAEAEKDEDDDQDKTVAEEHGYDSSDIGGGPKKDSDRPKEPKGFKPTTDLSVGVKNDPSKPGAEDPNWKKSPIQPKNTAKAAMDEDEHDFDVDTPQAAPDDTFANQDDKKDQSLEGLKAELAGLSSRIAELEGGSGEDNDPQADGNPFTDGHEDNSSDGGYADFDNDGDQHDDKFNGDEDGLDLEAIIRELEAQLGETEDTEKGLSPGDNPKTHDDDEPPHVGGTAIAETWDDGAEAGTDKGEDPKVVQSPPNIPARVMEDDKDDDKKDDDDVVDLDEILREMEADMKGDEFEKGAKKLKDTEVGKDLDEAYKTIKSLQKTINEVNLLNAKLLFANKLFRAHNMTNEQKVKVIETLDRTKSVREVKLVYSTLAENFKFPTQQKTSAVKKSITEGLASKVVKSTKPAATGTVQGKAIIAESTAQQDRFKKLAGILK